MKFKILILAALLPFFAAAQTPDFTVSGKIGDINAPGKVYFDYMKNGVNVSDSSFLVNGTFSFSGYTPDFTAARLVISHNGKGIGDAIYNAGEVVYLYIGKEQMSITSKDSLINAAIKESTTNDDFMQYNKDVGGSMQELTKAANAEYNRLTPEQQKDTTAVKVVDRHFHEAIKARAQAQLKFAENNPDSFFALIALSEAAQDPAYMEKAESIYHGLSARVLTTEMGVAFGPELAERINALSITAVGKDAPQFTQNDVSGKPLSLASFKGRVVLVDFWASWCHPCRGENPNLLKQYQLYKDRGFTILSVSMDSERKNWLTAIKQDGLPWPQVSDLKGWKNEAGRLYGVRGIPACFLIGTDGKIIANDLRGETLNKKLAEIFKN